MKTGEDVRALGLYASDCCTREALFDVDDCFSRCPQCSGLCDWDVVDISSAKAELRNLRDSVSIAKLWSRTPGVVPGTFRYSF